MYFVLILFLMVLPWVATAAGSLMALKLPIQSNRRQGIYLGFAAGVMIASSVWSLLLPAFDRAGEGIVACLIVSAGFGLGVLGMLALDKLMPHQHMGEDVPEGRPSHLSRPMLLVMAVALHNIPEGMALGVVMAAVTNRESFLNIAAAAAFGLGLALQNFPEGMAVVLPMRQAGKDEKFCRKWGIIASFAEPAAAIIGFVLAALLTQLGTIIMPILLAMAAGAMVFIVVEELIPESQHLDSGHSATYGFLAGFWVMAMMGALGG